MGVLGGWALSYERGAPVDLLGNFPIQITPNYFTSTNPDSKTKSAIFDFPIPKKMAARKSESDFLGAILPRNSTSNIVVLVWS